MAGDKTRVTIVDQNSGEGYHVILPTGVPTRQVLPALIKRPEMPATEPGAAPMRYHLALKTSDGNTCHEEDDTLAEASVAGAVLRIMPQMTAGLVEVHEVRYFSLRLTRLDGSPLFETDLVPDGLELSVHHLASMLVQQGFFTPGELSNVRIIPRTDRPPTATHTCTLRPRPRR